MNRLQYVAGATGVSEELLVELEGITHCELGPRNIEHARSVASGIGDGFSVLSAARACAGQPSTLGWLFDYEGV